MNENLKNMKKGQMLWSFTVLTNIYVVNSNIQNRPSFVKQQQQQQKTPKNSPT